MVRNQFPAQVVITSCPKIVIFSQFQVYIQVKQIINLSLLNNFCPVIPYRRVEKESDELLNTVWSLVMVRSQLPAQVNLLSQNCYIYVINKIVKTNNKFITSQ